MITNISFHIKSQNTIYFMGKVVDFVIWVCSSYVSLFWEPFKAAVNNSDDGIEAIGEEINNTRYVYHPSWIERGRTTKTGGSYYLSKQRIRPETQDRRNKIGSDQEGK